MGGSNTSYNIVVVNYNGSDIRDNGNGITIPTNTECAIRIYVESGTTLSNKVFKPMLTTNDSVTYDAFVPYTGDRDTLTDDHAEIKNDLDPIPESQAISTKEYPLDRDAPEFGGDEKNVNIKRRGVFGYLSGRFDADYFNNGKLYESCFKQYMQINGRKCRYICKLGNVQEFEMVDEQLISFSYSSTNAVNAENFVTVNGKLYIRDVSKDYNSKYPDDTCGMTSGYVLLFIPISTSGGSAPTIPDTIYNASFSLNKIPILWLGDL